MEKVKCSEIIGSETISCENCRFQGESVFKTMTNPELKKLSSTKTTRHYKRRELIFDIDEYPAGLFCVVEGGVKIYKTGIDGRDQILRLAGPGSLLGYRSLLSGEKFSSRAEALQDTKLCFVEKKTFLELMDQNASVREDVIAGLCRDLRQAEERVKNFAQKPVRERMAETLLFLGENFGNPVKDGVQIYLRLTRLEIAELAGTVIETAVRHLTELKKEGLIKLTGKSIQLVNIPELKKVANVE